jgi:hypothetical protein
VWTHNSAKDFFQDKQFERLVVADDSAALEDLLGALQESALHCSEC